MTTRRDPDALLTAYLAVGMEVLPDRVVDSILDEVHRTRVRAVFGPWRTRSMSRTAFAAAAVVAVIALGGAVFVAQRGQPAIVAPSPTASASANPSLPAVAVPSATVAPTPSAAVSPPAVGQSLKLAWTKVSLDQRSPQVVWFGNQFVLVDQDSSAVFTSADGFSWHAIQPGDPDPGYLELMRPRHIGAYLSWQDQIVGWWNPEDGPDVAGKPPITARDIVRIVRPPAAPTETTPFKGGIDSLAIGPAGIVAIVGSDLDFDAWVTKKFGLRTNNDWTCCVKDVTFQNGVLQIKLNNRPGLKVNWADEGFLPGDYMYTGFGWFSPDGVEWTPIPGYATDFNLNEIIGVSDGFIGQGEAAEGRCSLPGGCGEMWHSSDGLTWRNLAHPGTEAAERPLLPWMGGVLATHGVSPFGLWTSDGYTELPVSAELQTAPKQPDVVIGTGPLGLVMIIPSENDKRILVTRDGVDWDLGPMPAAMAADQTLSFGSSRPYDMPIVAVGDRSVLVVLWSGSREAKTPSLWRGTFEP